MENKQLSLRALKRLRKQYKSKRKDESMRVLSRMTTSIMKHKQVQHFEKAEIESKKRLINSLKEMPK